MPNTTGAESVHSAIQKCHTKKKVDLIEACEVDQNRAVAQIAAYTSYVNGVHRGKGPTLFELAFRSADTVGTPKKFVDATNLWVASSPQYDLGRTEPLPGDVRTTSRKRKGKASANITPEDSHRHDTVLITSPNTRAFSRRNLHATQFQSLPSDHGTRSGCDTAEIPSTPLFRPATRSRPAPNSAAPARDYQPVPEFQVPLGTWHLRRTTSGRHRGPQCNATCSNRSSRPDCRNFIKQVGYQIDGKSGVVAVAIEGHYRAPQYKITLWFCPNNVCHRSCPRFGISTLPAVPTTLRVQQGTDLTGAEIEFLSSQGLQFVGHPRIADLPLQDGSSLRIDVNTYPERIDITNPTLRIPFRNSVRVRQRNSYTAKHLERMERAEREDMTVVSIQTVMEGNAYGKRLCIRTHEREDNIQTKEYWVQICCFPTCSCDDYWKHHWYKHRYLPCKHQYWVFKNVFRLNIQENLLVLQPVWTVAELNDVLERQTTIP